jgi:cytosine deaminase
LITTNGDKALGIEEGYGIKEGNRANLIVIDSESEYESICTKAPVLYSIRNGK